MSARFRLRELLDAAEVNQSEFAKLADVSFATVNRLCTNATSQVSLETVDKVLEALARLGRKAEVSDLIAWQPARGAQAKRTAKAAST